MLKHSENLWKVDPNAFHSTGSSEDKLHFLLKFAVLAPSGHNTQPWIFKIGNDRVELYADRTRCLAVADPQDRELTISCGAALGNLEVALKHFAYKGNLLLLPDEKEPDHLASIGLGGRYERTERDVKLFEAIQKRRTNRRKFEDRAVPSEVMTELREVAKEFGVELLMMEEKGSKVKDIGAMVAEADRRQFANVHFRRELASWIHSLRSSTHDGMAPYSMGLPRMLDPAAPFMAMVMRRFDVGEGRAATDEDVATHSPALAIISTKGDTPKDWIMTGRALSKMLLTLTAKGVSASYLNQVLQVPELRKELAEKLQIKGHPQILLRIGYGPHVEPSARRPLSQVVRFI